MILSLTTNTLKLVFEKRTDRWGHRVVILDGDREITFLRSFEGDNQQAWPPSPPLQDLSRHELPTGDALLAVGMAGTAHWSASFSSDGTSDSIMADIACLCKKQRPQSAATLMSSYEISPDVVVARGENDGMTLTMDHQSVSIEPLSGDHWKSAWTQQENRLVFAACAFSEQASRATRWGYRMSREGLLY